MSEAANTLVSPADIKYAAPDQILTAKIVPDLGTLAALGAFGVGIVSAAPGLLSLGFFTAPLALGLSALLGVCNIIKTSRGMASVGQAAAGDDPVLADCRAAFNKEATSSLTSQGISLVGTAAAFFFAAQAFGSVLAGDGATFLLCGSLSAAGASVAALFNFKAREASRTANAYGAAVLRQEAPPHP